MAVGTFKTNGIYTNASIPPNNQDNYFQVKFIDFDGEVLKEEWVISGGTATPPLLPTHPYLTFQEWNNDYSNIFKDINIGATYTTTDGYSHLWVTIGTTGTTGMQPTIYMYKNSGTGLLTLDWGDGEVSTTTDVGNYTLTKPNPYANPGEYHITVICENNGAYRFGQTISAATVIFSNGTYRAIATRIYLSSDVQVIPQNAFYYCVSLNKLSMSNAIIAFGGGALNGIMSLKGIVFPKSCGTFNRPTPNCFGIQNMSVPETSKINGGYLQNCYGIQEHILPEATTDIWDFQFNNAFSLKTLLIPESVLTVGNSAFLFRAMDDLVFQPIIPPTLTATSFVTPIYSPNFRIYVPDDSLNDYKTATNWVLMADYIYPISQRIIKPRL